MTTRVKICGITNYGDAIDAVECGTDALGFNFYRLSKRFVTPELVHEIVAKLPPDVMKIGVFVNEHIEQIVEIAAMATLDGVQLHGEETPEFVDELRLNLSLPIIKAFRVSGVHVVDEIAEYRVDCVLLDANSTKDRGGTGETFDWEIAKLVADFYPKTYLAGGLSADNVAVAISIAKPYAVDACSLLESEPGKKDRVKVARFVAAAKGAI
jgi:phosphoribosylanthranilate isomerase